MTVIVDLLFYITLYLFPQITLVYIISLTILLAIQGPYFHYTDPQFVNFLLDDFVVLAHAFHDYRLAARNAVAA